MTTTGAGTASAAVRYTDSRSMPWVPHVLEGSVCKVLDTDADADNYVQLRYVVPGGAPRGRRLHLSVNETFYFTFGDFPSFEYDSMQDLAGHVENYTKGKFMDRMPHSIHGREPEPESVTGSELLIWTSHGGEFEVDTVETVHFPNTPDAEAPAGTSPHPAPAIVDSHVLSWQDHPQSPGVQQKILSAEDNAPNKTPRPVKLVYLPSRWPEAPLALNAVETRAWVYCLAGGAGLTVDGTDYVLSEGAYLRWQPGVSATVTQSAPDGCRLLVVGHDFSGVGTGD
jgi:hypothetical protein